MAASWVMVALLCAFNGGMHATGTGSAPSGLSTSNRDPHVRTGYTETPSPSQAGHVAEEEHPFARVKRWTQEQWNRRPMPRWTIPTEGGYTIHDVSDFSAWLTHTQTSPNSQTANATRISLSGSLIVYIVHQLRLHGHGSVSRSPISDIVAAVRDAIPAELAMPEDCQLDLEAWTTRFFIDPDPSTLDLHRLYLHHKAWHRMWAYDRTATVVVSNVRTSYFTSTTPISNPSSHGEHAGTSQSCSTPNMPSSPNCLQPVAPDLSSTSNSPCERRNKSDPKSDKGAEGSAKEGTDDTSDGELTSTTPSTNLKRTSGSTSMLVWAGGLLVGSIGTYMHVSSQAPAQEPERNSNPLLGTQLIAKGVLASALALRMSLRLFTRTRPVEGPDASLPSSQLPSYRQLPWWIWVIVTVAIIAVSAGLVAVFRFLRRHFRDRQYAAWQVQKLEQLMQPIPEEP